MIVPTVKNFLYCALFLSCWCNFFTCFCLVVIFSSSLAGKKKKNWCVFLAFAVLRQNLSLGSDEVQRTCGWGRDLGLEGPNH